MSGEYDNKYYICGRSSECMFSVNSGVSASPLLNVPLRRHGISIIRETFIMVRVLHRTMDPLNPLRCIDGRGSNTWVAEALNLVASGTSVKEIYIETDVGSERTVKDWVRSLEQEGYIDDEISLTPAGAKTMRQMIAGVRIHLQRHMSEEFAGSLIDCHDKAAESIIATGWVNEMPDDPPITECDHDSYAAHLVNDLREIDFTDR